MIDNTNLLNYSICFSELTSANWSNDDKYNKIFIHNVEAYINEIIQLVGYISWEKINESLGVNPSPDDIDRIKVYRDKRKIFRLKLNQINPVHETPCYEISFKEE